MLPILDLPCLDLLAPVLAESGVQLGRAGGRLHPLLVHFPIGLGLVAVGIEWWRSLSRRDGLSPLTLPLLWIAAISALASTATGWVNAAYEHGNSTDETLQLHRWIGTATAIGFVVLAWWCQLLAAQARTAAAGTQAALGTFRWAALAGAIAMSVTGHLGGDLVHGKGYLTELLFPPSVREEAPREVETIELSANDRFFIEKVRPVLESHCFECHGARKQKGGLRMDSEAWLFNGEEEHWTVVPGKSAESLLLQRIVLDRADPDAMPPEGDGLTDDEKAVIRKWIDDGAAYPDATEVALAGDASTAAAPGGPATAVDRVDAAVKAKADAAAKALIARGVLVQPIAADSPYFDVNASRAEPPIADADAPLFADIAPLVVNLNLAQSALTDAGVPALGSFAALERLRLDGTAVGDAGLRALGSVPKLESINLVGSKVGADSVAWFAAQAALKRVYVWQTGLDTPEAIASIGAGGKVQVVGGDLPLAQPKGPPMPEDPPAEKPAEASADKPA